MGIQLVNAALNPYWAQLLSDRDQLVLVKMAAMCLDEGPDAGQYFAGHDTAALAVKGNTNPDNLRLVRRSVQNLIKAGALSCIQGPPRTRRGRRTSTYQLHLTTFRL